MSWSYSGDPAASNLDAVRFLVSDTDTNDQLVSNEEVNYQIAQEGNVYRAAAAVCKSIAIKVGRQVSLKGQVQIDADEQYKHWMDLAKELTARAARSSVTPYAGGITQSDKDQREQNSDRVAPSFTRSLHIPPGLDQGANNPNIEHLI